ncbi:MAG: SBBP repeat-containing protein [candidate division WOR-3 bacterium]
MGSAQVATYADDIAWVRRYNGPGNGTDVARAIVVDGSGNVYVTGYSYGGSTPNYDFATIKYSTLGESLWAVRYNYANNADSACAIAIDDSGYVYVTGSSWNGSNMDYATIKYDSIGNQKWVARYNYSNGNDYARAIAVDDSGNVYVTGYSYGNYYDYATIKYKPNGDTAWVRRYDGPRHRDDYAYAIAVDSLGNVYVTGSSESSGTYLDYTTIKYGPSGEKLWVKRYNGPGNGEDYSYAITVDKSGYVYVTGGSTGSATMYDYATIKYNANGDTLWVRRYNGPGNGSDYARAIAVDQNGNIYVTGVSTGSGNQQEDYATIKYNSSGVMQWEARYNYAEGKDYAYGIAVSSSMRNVYVTGASWGGTNMDYATIKYYSRGNVVSQEKEWRYDKGGSDYSYAIALDNSGGVYVTGYSDSANNYDYLTIKYTPPVGVEENRCEHQIPSEVNLKVCPTFGVGTKIRYSLQEAGKVSLQLFDISGRLIKTLTDEYKEPGVWTVTWDGRDEQNNKTRSGLYFLMLKAEGRRVRRKVLLLRE